MVIWAKQCFLLQLCFKQIQFLNTFPFSLEWIFKGREGRYRKFNCYTMQESPAEVLINQFLSELKWFNMQLIRGYDFFRFNHKCVSKKSRSERVEWHDIKISLFTTKITYRFTSQYWLSSVTSNNVCSATVIFLRIRNSQHFFNILNSPISIF